MIINKCGVITVTQENNIMLEILDNLFGVDVDLKHYTSSLPRKF